MNLKELAGQIAACFEVAERKPAETYIRVKAGSAEEIKDLCHKAHGDMLPDDWRYKMISECLDQIASVDDIDAARDELEPSIYSSELLDWLGSRNDRSGYCDEAVESGLLVAEADMMTRI